MLLQVLLNLLIRGIKFIIKLNLFNKLIIKQVIFELLAEFFIVNVRIAARFHKERRRGSKKRTREVVFFKKFQDLSA